MKRARRYPKKKKPTQVNPPGNAGRLQTEYRKMWRDAHSAIRGTLK